MSLSVSSSPAVPAPVWSLGADAPVSRQRLALALLVRLSGRASSSDEPWSRAVDALFPAEALGARPGAAREPLAFCQACADELPASALHSPAARLASEQLLPGLQALWRAEHQAALTPQ